MRQYADFYADYTLLGMATHCAATDLGKINVLTEPIERLAKSIGERIDAPEVWHANDALSKSRAIGDRKREADALLVHGLSSQDAGDLNGALHSYLKALRIRQNRSVTGEAEAWMHVGFARSDLG